MVFYYLLLFVLGIAFGSFLNVLADRLTFGKTILGRSYCDHCGRTLGAMDLVPLVSFLALGGRCRVCKKPISWQNPIIELLTGFIFLTSFAKFAATSSLNLLNLAFILFVSSILIVVATVDFKFSLIPTALVFLSSLVSLFFNYFTLDSAGFIESVIAAFVMAAFFGAIVILTRGRGMGQGDIPLAFLIGLVLGVSNGLLATFLAFLTGAVVAVLLMFAGKKRFGQTIPFAPFLVLGFFISLYFGREIISWYLVLY